MFKTTKSKIIFVIIFSILCITITTFLVIYKNIDVEDQNTNIDEIAVENNKDFPGIDLKGTYDQNDLQIEQQTIEKEKIHIDYCQIKGLKDKTIQDKINKELYETAINCYQEKIKDLNEVVNVNVTVWNSANFANTISFTLNYYAKIDDDSDDFYQDNKGLNYDLNTGEKIKLDRLFTSDAPIENILRTSSYYSFIQNKTEFNLNGDFVINDYGDIEEEIAEIIIRYKSGDLKEYSYTPDSIMIYYDENKTIYIDMKEHAEYVAIYNRYLTDKALYENNNIGIKNIYTLATRYKEPYYFYVNYQNENNYFIDITILRYTEDDFSKKLLDEKIKAIEEEIEKLKTLASKNTNTFYILNYTISAYTAEDWHTKQQQTTYQELGNVYEMTVHDFEESIEPIIMDYNRNAFGGEIPSYLYNFEDLLKIGAQETVEYYNPQTGEKIVI